MNWFRPRSLFALIAFGLAALQSSGASMPFTLSSPDGLWRMITVKRTLKPAYTIEAFVLSTNNRDRFVVISLPLDEQGSSTLDGFTQQLVDSFVEGKAVDKDARSAAKIGFEGREILFALKDPNQVYDCDLFTFVDGPTGWGLLYLSPKNGESHPAAPPFELFQKGPPLPAGTVGLAAYRVSEDPINSFPFAFRVLSNPANSKVAKLVVTDVVVDSDAERAGIKVGDEILTINGRDAHEFSNAVGKKTELGLIFLNRAPGDQVTLKLMGADGKRPWTATLGVPRGLSRLDAWARR